MSKYAPKREDGLYAYVVTTKSFTYKTSRIEWAKSLADAKAEHGWTRQLHTFVSVRRATPGDLS